MKGHFREEQLPMNNAWKFFSHLSISGALNAIPKSDILQKKGKNFQASLYTSNDNQADENKNLRPNEGAK